MKSTARPAGLPAQAGVPALALAGEVKFPTARNTLIGTGKADIAAYLIGSKRWGRLDTHANVSYSVVGQRASIGLSVDNNGAVLFRPGLTMRFR